MTNDPAIEVESGYWLTSTTACWHCGHSTAFAVLVATSGREWEDGDSSSIDAPVFINEPGDLPARLIAQVQGLVPSIDTPDDDPESCLLNRCGHCDAVLDDWHLCKVDGPLRAGDGTPMPGAKATVLDGTPFALADCGTYRAEIQAVLDAALKAD